MRPLPRSPLVIAVAALLAGCGSLSGPSLDFTAPKVSGRVLDSESGRPVANALVGRKLWTWKRSTGGFLKAAEEATLRQEYVRTDSEGRFLIPSKRVALLFSVGDVRLNTTLSVQHGKYSAWQTNFPTASLSSNNPAPAILNCEVRITGR